MTIINDTTGKRGKESGIEHRSAVCTTRTRSSFRLKPSSEPRSESNGELVPHRSHRKSSILAHFSWNWLLVLLLVSRGYEGSAQAPAEKEESPKIGSAKRILAIDEKTLGPDDPELAKSLNRLAALYQEAGNFAKAEPLFQRVLRINEKALGSEHPDTAESLNNLAFLSLDLKACRPRPSFQDRSDQMIPFTRIFRLLLQRHTINRINEQH